MSEAATAYLFANSLSGQRPDLPLRARPVRICDPCWGCFYSGPASTQNSLPSGSRITVWLRYRWTTLAPSFFSLATSVATSPGARRSKCIRFLADLASGTLLN